MDVLEAIRNRRSHRAFLDRPVEQEKLDAIIEAGCWAPSPANSQPWEFIIITADADKDRIIDMSESARLAGKVEVHGYFYIRPLPFQNVEEEEAEREEALRRYSLTFLKKVPALIAVVGLTRTTIKAESLRGADDGYKYACAAAIQNMLLAAHAEGLGSLWYTLFDSRELGQFLRLDPVKHVVALVCLGYPARKPSSPGRHPFQAKVRRL